MLINQLETQTKMLDDNRTAFHRFSDKHPSFYIWLKSQKNPFRSMTSPLRILPTFIIFGVSRSGTRSLNKYLNQHTSIRMASRPEVHFFNKSDNFHQGINWYKSFFPTKVYRDLFESRTKSKLQCGDATPDYMYNPNSPERIKKYLPDVKLIAVLRNPIDRAYSHYHYMVRTRREDLSFDEAIKNEKNRIEDDLLMHNYDGDNYRRYSYLRRGIYVNQLETWYNAFPKQRILIIKSEDLANDDSIQKTLDEVFEFLNVSTFKIKNKGKVNIGKYPPMNSKLRKELSDYFRPHNLKLSSFLKMKFEWD